MCDPISDCSIHQDVFNNWFIKYKTLFNAEDGKNIESYSRSLSNTFNNMPGDQAIIIKNVSQEIITKYNEDNENNQAIMMGMFNNIPCYIIRRKSICPEIFDQPVHQSDNKIGFCYAAGASLIIKFDNKLYGLYHKDIHRPFETCPGGSCSRKEWSQCIEKKTNYQKFFLDIASRKINEETLGKLKGTDEKLDGIKNIETLSELCRIKFKQQYFGIDGLEDTYTMFGSILSSSNDPFFSKLFDSKNYCSTTHTYTLYYEDGYETEYVCARELIVPTIEFTDLKQLVEWIKYNHYSFNDKKISMLDQVAHYLNLLSHKYPSFTCSNIVGSSYYSAYLKEIAILPPNMLLMEMLFE
jgi:hypothetical protein